LNSILCITFCPKKSSVLCIVLMNFHLEISLTYFVSQYHYISLSLTLTFLSNYILVDSSTKMPIQYCVVGKIYAKFVSTSTFKNTKRKQCYFVVTYLVMLLLFRLYSGG
jgi:hypothetical protein